MNEDGYPAGSMCIDGTPKQAMGGNSVYDGHDYIKADIKRGEALWYELITKNYDEE